VGRRGRCTGGEGWGGGERGVFRSVSCYGSCAAMRVHGLGFAAAVWRVRAPRPVAREPAAPLPPAGARAADARGGEPGGGRQPLRAQRQGRQAAGEPPLGAVGRRRWCCCCCCCRLLRATLRAVWRLQWLRMPLARVPHSCSWLLGYRWQQADAPPHPRTPTHPHTHTHTHPHTHTHTPTHPHTHTHTHPHTHTPTHPHTHTPTHPHTHTPTHTPHPHPHRCAPGPSPRSSTPASPARTAWHWPRSPSRWRSRLGASGS
jgi:hypothetical protein